MVMKLSFAITVHSEYDYIRALVSVLAEYIHLNSDGHQYEIVVVDDNSDERTKAFLFQAYQSFPRFISVHNHTLNGDFAAHKNFMNSKCTGDFILHLDADEHISPRVIAWIPDLIAENPDVDAYWIPRINTVDGLTAGSCAEVGMANFDAGRLYEIGVETQDITRGIRLPEIV
jgi:glycosyltransferase involved in cell wall biosynthesis